MRILFVLLLLATAVSCATEQAISTTSSAPENKIQGTVITLARRTAEGLTNDIEYYLRVDGKNYFIKFSESDITLKSLQKEEGNIICVDGTIKVGLWEPQKPVSISSPETQTKARSGQYITIKAIVPCN